jgi:Root hair defective 3 GTP-binding protein (RHD3)
MGLLKIVSESTWAYQKTGRVRQFTYTPPPTSEFPALSCVNPCGSNSQAKRTVLFFVISGDPCTTLLLNLQVTRSRDVHRIWDVLVKPAGLGDTRPEEYFDFVFGARRHKVSSRRPR